MYNTQTSYFIVREGVGLGTLVNTIFDSVKQETVENERGGDSVDDPGSPKESVQMSSSSASGLPGGAASRVGKRNPCSNLGHEQI